MRGEEIDIAEHALLTSTMVRVAQRIGLNRIPRNIGPTFGDVLRAGIEHDRELAERNRNIEHGEREASS